MFQASSSSGLQQTTSYKVVLPFYVYGALSFLVACILLLLNTNIVYQHYFHPQTLAITHLMALGWGTMIILGASHQLVPVLIEGKLSSETLARWSFILAAVGIPFLVAAFYVFHTGWVMQTGGILINSAVVCYLVNVFKSIKGSQHGKVHAWFIAVASIWLLTTTGFGLVLVLNFTYSFLPTNSIEYLSVHAHLGIAGWFLLLVLGVGSRLIPMFLISKYVDNQRLWWVFGLVNAALILFLVLKVLHLSGKIYYLAALPGLLALVLFAVYCYTAYKQRIRKQVDEQMKISLLSVALLFLPLISLLVIIYFVTTAVSANMVLLYGFCIFFGWITAIILGMTFKTLPFIVWNKVYHTRAVGKTPAPKELFSERLFNGMSVLYLLGFLSFLAGTIFLNDMLLKFGSAALLASAVLYVWNVFKTLYHQPETSWK